MTKMKSPKLKIIKGKEIAFRIGLIKKLIKPKIKPAIDKVKRSPSKTKPGNK